MQMAEAEAKEYLRQIELLDSLINCKLEEVDNLKALTTKITTTLKQDVVSSSGSQDKLGDIVAKIVDYEAEIDQMIDELIDRKREISNIIEKVSDPDQLKVLCKRYLLFEPWEQIAWELGYTYRHTTRIHGDALLAVQEIMKGK